MTKEKAIKIAIELLDREINRISITADYHDIQKLDWSTAVGASKRRKELLEVKEIISNL